MVARVTKGHFQLIKEGTSLLLLQVELEKEDPSSVSDKFNDYRYAVEMMLIWRHHQDSFHQLSASGGHAC